jgi:hypothetical protein
MGSGTSSPLDASNLPFVQLEALEGQWVIVRTTLPLWLKGDRLHPTLNYTVVGPTKLGDCVRYRSKSSTSMSEIVGVNTQQQVPAGSAKMEWRGSGALCWVTSDWAVVHMSQVVPSSSEPTSGSSADSAAGCGSGSSREECKNANGGSRDDACTPQLLTVGIIYFSKTMFTPEGMDVIVRVPHPSSALSSMPSPTAKELLARIPEGALAQVDELVVKNHPQLSHLVASLQHLPDS